MGMNSVRGPPNASNPVDASSDKVAKLAVELNALTDRMESEWNERRTISPENALQLADLRKRFERLLAK